jgi:hypothetical protein
VQRLASFSRVVLFDKRGWGCRTATLALRPNPGLTTKSSNELGFGLVEART